MEIRGRPFSTTAVSAGDPKVSAGQTELLALFDADSASYTHAEWSAQDDAETQNAAVVSMLEEGCSANFVTFALGTTLAEGQSSGGGAGEHMTSFDYAYKLEAVRDWLFQQRKKGSIQKFVGGTALWMPKSGSPYAPSEKAIEELKDTDFPFPMPYGGKRKGLIAIPTRFCIEPKKHKNSVDCFENKSARFSLCEAGRSAFIFFYKVNPPLTGTTAPVMKEASSLARKLMMPAISSLVHMRFKGVAEMSFSFILLILRAACIRQLFCFSFGKRIQKNRVDLGWRIWQNKVIRKQEEVPFHEEAACMHSESYLFFTRHKGQKVQMCDDTARYRIQRYAAAAKENCPDVPDNPHPHMWRHTRAMHLYQHGMDLERISQWLGHSQLETTLIYAHSDTEDKRKAIAAALGDGVTGQLNNAPYTVDDEEILRKLYGL